MSDTRQTCTLSLFPDIKTPLPGPRTQALIERDQKYVSSSYTRGYPFAIERGRGAVVEDPDGNLFLDYCAGIAVTATGHSHPRVIKAIQEQSEKFLHMSGTDFYYQGLADLAERLALSAPGASGKRVFLSNSGAEANEGALKLVRYATKRTQVISFFRSFHGRTYGAMSLTASKSIQKSHFAPLVPGVHHAHYPYHYRDIFQGATPDETAANCLKYIEDYLFKMVVPAEEVAAFFIEPVQGEGGYVVPPASFISGLQALARKHGILIVADEVQSGFGRTGKMWASQHFEGFEPDVITSAKGIASGLPLGAMIARTEIMQWPPGTHATTFGGNPVSCAASLATLDLLEDGLLRNAATQGAYLRQKLEGLMGEFDVIGDVRGLGLMLGMEIVASKAGREKAPDLRNEIVDACFFEGLLILGCGENTIRFSPPLVICQEQTDAAIAILRKVLMRLAK